jgi:beta-mannosidase
LRLEGADVVFSDNYFDLPANQTATVTCPVPTSWTLESAREALKVYSLWESYA